nr:hypothetical protein [uncultured Rhodoferax sp.]
MKAVFRVKAYVCGVLLLGTAMGSAGLTLGRTQGAVFIGKPLDLRVQVQFDPAEDVQATCMDAEVFYGDTVLESSRVSVVVEPAAAASTQGPTVRVTSTVLVNEPIITVNFRVGCQQKLSKRYTVFPEVAPNVVEPPTVRVPSRNAPPKVALPVVPAAQSPAPTPAPTPNPLANGASPSPVERPAPKPARRAAPSQEPAPAAASVRTKPAAKASGKSRLKLDPLDLLIEHDPVLQATTELMTLPQENPAARAEAAALWRSLNTSPEDLLQQEAKAKAFEKDLKSLYAITAQNQKGLMDLVAKVERAESERYANGLVYALAGLLLTSLLVLAWVWRRAQRSQPSHWRDGMDSGDSLMAELVKAPPVSRPRPPVAAAGPVPVDADPPSSARSPLDFDLSELGLAPQPAAAADAVQDSFAGSESASLDTVPRPRSAIGATQAIGRDFSPSVFGGSRAIDSTELLDVRKQASFFMSLGEVQQAIDVLVNHIAQVGESSPLVCLDLLKIYYKEGREPEYEALRQEFNNWFTGRVPVIDHFADEGRGLEKYPNVLDQIVAMWPDPRVLEYIENCMYHHSSDEYEPHFDLLAYRELLLLHGIAKRIVRMSDDAHDAAALVRIAARAPSGDSADLPGSGDVAHRMGAQHRGAWKRNPVPLPKSRQKVKDPQTDVETSGSPLEGTTDFDFFDLR